MTFDHQAIANVKLRNKAEQKRYALTKALVGEARGVRDRGDDAQFAIDNPRGLLIRVRSGEILYYVQARGPSGVTKRKICAVSEINFADIKKLAADAVAAIKSGRSADVVIAAGLAKKEKGEVDIALDRADAVEQRLWTFGEIVDQFSARTETKEGVVKKKLSRSSLREINDRLRNRPEASPLMNRYVKELRLEDFELVRDKIDASGGGASSAAKFIDLSRRILSWAAKFRRRMTGLDPMQPWWHTLAHEYKPADRSRRYLTPDQAGMLVALLEGVRALEGHSTDSVFGALEFVWLTCQRSSAVVGMRSFKSDRWKRDPLENHIGWHVYTWTADEVKGKRECKLSIPPDAMAILGRVAKSSHTETGIDSTWAFPQARNKYALRMYATSKNDARIRELDKHITPSALNHALDALAGRKPGWPNVLQIVGLPNRIGPHDLRRSLTTFFDNRGLGSYASALLDHKITGTDKMSEHVAAVTQGVYSAADRVMFKAEGLVIWLAAVLPCYEKAKSDPRLLAAIEARRSSLECNKKKAIEKRNATLEAKRKEMRNDLHIDDTSEGALT